MKNKLFVGVFGIFLMFFGIIGVRAEESKIPTLEQIANKFNNSEIVKEYATYDIIWKAETKDNQIIITGKTEENSSSATYKLDGNILSTTASKEKAFDVAVFTLALFDCIGQFHGYSEGELRPTLNSAIISQYTLEKEGLLIKNDEDDNLIAKIDISKKIPLIDFSNVYIEVSDLQTIKSFLVGEGSAEKSKGNIYFHKSNKDKKNILLIAEKNKLTENSYKSILSILEVMYNGNEITKYFKENYSSISENKEFEGFKIEIEPVKTQFESTIIPDDSNYKFLRITIDTEELKESNNNSNDNNNSNNAETGKQQENPKTAEVNNNLAVLILTVSIGLIIIGKKKLKKLCK